MLQTKILTPVLALCLLGVAAGAQATGPADPGDLREVAPIAGLSKLMSLDIRGGDFNGNVSGYVGMYQIEPQTPAGSFAAYCVDPFQHGNNAFQTYLRSAPLTAAALPPVQADRFADVIKLFGNAYSDSLTGATKAAGFQIALWEAWYDDKDLTATSGRIYNYSDTDARNEAQSLLNSLSGWSPGTAYDLTLYTNDTYQDYVAVVPEPETYALLLAGLGLVGGMLRRGARQTA